MKAIVDVRAAEVKDVPQILDFITQLAIFEKAEDRVLATQESLARTLGLESPNHSDITSTELKPGQFAKCVIAFVDGDAAGFAVFFYSYSTVSLRNILMQWLSAPGIYMEDLFVSPSFRSLGVGSALLSYLGRHARAIGATRIDWAVLRWNVGARTFYRETCGGEELEEWLGVRVEGAEAIAKLIALNE
jgi:GNAT superfamily N-acetyltransferase